MWAICAPTHGSSGSPARWTLVAVILAHLFSFPAAYDTVSASDWDYFILVRQWEPTTCLLRSCRFDPANRFTIHGLWPENNDGSWPEYCRNDAFSLDDIPDLVDDMRQKWPSEYGKNFAFWNHEWRRHGTCAENVFGTPHDFFASVLALHERFDLQAALSGLDLQLDTKYLQSELEDRLSDELGSRVWTHCDSGLLTELWLCVDKHLNPVDCPANLLRQCKTIQLPSAGGWSGRLALRSTWIWLLSTVAVVATACALALAHWQKRWTTSYEKLHDVD